MHMLCPPHWIALGVFGMTFQCGSHARLRSMAEADRARITIPVLEPTGRTRYARRFRFRVLLDQDPLTTGALRIPNGAGPFPAAVLVVGQETGSSAVSLVDEKYRVVVAALDYPSVASSGAPGPGTARAYRRMGIRTTAALSRLVGVLAARSDVRPDDITIVAVSFGVFTGTPAAAMDKRVRRLLVIQAGGDLSAILNANRRRLDIPRCLVPVGAFILRDLEPNLHVPHLAPRPLLLVTASRDEFFPAESLQSFFAYARTPKQRLSFGRTHLLPHQRERIRELTRLTAEHLYGGRSTPAR